MTISRPLVSIAMPLYNEEAHLAKALEALLAQDYENIEIVICDNASNDDTQTISQAWAVRDCRIKYYRNDTNIGAAKNFSRAFNLTHGDFFMWAAGHDLWAPTFISRCMEVFLQDDCVSLCYPFLQWISLDGELLTVEDINADLRGLGEIQRYLHAIWRLPQNAISGLIRRSALERTRPVRQTLGPGQVLLVELSLLGPFAQVREPLFFRRINRPSETKAQATARRSVDLWEDRKRKTNHHMYYWQFVVEIFKGINHVTSGWQKIKLLLMAIPITSLRYHRVLIKDIVRLFI